MSADIPELGTGLTGALCDPDELTSRLEDILTRLADLSEWSFADRPLLDQIDEHLSALEDERKTQN